MSPIDSSQINSVLAKFAQRYRLKRGVVIDRRRGFSGAAVFRVETVSGDYCLRGWNRGSLPTERIIGLHRLLKHLHASGVSQVSVPVASLERSTLVRHGERYWQLEPWLPGVALYHERPTRNRLISAMETLAGWHQSAATFVPAVDERTWFRTEVRSPSPAVGERLKKIRRWLSGRADRLRRNVREDTGSEFQRLARRILNAFDVIAPRIAEELDSLSHREYALQPCLRDVWHDHVLFTGERVTGLIDASACRVENVATDLARMLGSLVEDDRASWNLAVEAYKQRRPFSDAEWELMRVLDRSGVLLSGLFWLDRKFLRGIRIDNEDAVIRRLRRIVRRLESLAGES